MVGISIAAARTRLGDPSFFELAVPCSLDALLAATGGTAIRPEAARGRVLTGVAPLQTAEPGEVSVLHNARYAGAAEQTRAGVVVVGAALAGRLPKTSCALVVADPHAGWAHVAQLFHPHPEPVPGAHPSSVVDPSATVHPTSEIGPGAVIGARVSIGAGCRIEANAVIGSGVTMGAGCRVGACASVSHAVLGDRVYIYPGARIGQEGFGFAITPDGFVTVPQLGRVILHDDVEVGANSCVDRGASHDTVIGAGTRIDNLVQIGHGARIGRECVMAALAGLSGSVTLGDFVQVGGQSGFAGHITVGSRARIGAQAGVISDLDPSANVVGSPAFPLREYFRHVAVLRRLARRSVDSGLGSAGKPPEDNAVPG